MFGGSLMYGSCVTGHSPYWRARHDKHYYDEDDEHDNEHDNEHDDSHSNKCDNKHNDKHNDDKS